jgi:hypothetical protein
MRECCSNDSSLGSYNMQNNNLAATFWRNIPPPSSGHMNWFRWILSVWQEEMCWLYRNTVRNVANQQISHSPNSYQWVACVVKFFIMQLLHAPVFSSLQSPNIFLFEHRVSILDSQSEIPFHNYTQYLRNGWLWS